MALMLRKYQTRVEVVNTVCENIEVFIDRAAHIRDLCKKTTVLSFHRFLINNGVEKMNNV
jgi:hypothetical protein